MRDLHSLCAKRLEFSGTSTPSIVEPMQQLSAWQNKLQQHLEVWLLATHEATPAMLSHDLCYEAAMSYQHEVIY